MHQTMSIATQKTHFWLVSQTAAIRRNQLRALKAYHKFTFDYISSEYGKLIGGRYGFKHGMR